MSRIINPFFLIGIICCFSSARCETPPLEGIDNALGVSGAMGTIGVLSTSLLITGDSYSFLVGNSAKIFFYIKYLPIFYTEDYYKRMVVQRTTSTPLDFRISMGNTGRKKFTQSILPYHLLRYEMQSSFIINFWPGMITLLILFCILIFLKGFEWVVIKANNKVFANTVYSKLRVPIQNIFYLVFYDAYPDIIYFSLVDYKFTKVKSGYDGFSFCMSLIFLVGGMLLIWSHIKLLIKQYHLLKQTGPLAEKDLAEFYKGHETVQLLFNGFKKSSILQQSCLIILLIRAVLLSIILVALYKNAIVQVVFFILLNLGTIVYGAAKRPFVSLGNTIQHLFFETLFFTINISELILAILDNSNDSAIDTRNNTGNFLIFVNIVFNFLVIIVTVVKAVIAIRDNLNGKQGAKTRPINSQPVVVNSVQKNSVLSSHGLPKTDIGDQEIIYNYNYSVPKTPSVNEKETIPPDVMVNNYNYLNESATVSINQSYMSGYSNQSFIAKNSNFNTPIKSYKFSFEDISDNIVYSKALKPLGEYESKSPSAHKVNNQSLMLKQLKVSKNIRTDIIVSDNQRKQQPAFYFDSVNLQSSPALNDLSPYSEPSFKKQRQKY